MKASGKPVALPPGKGPPPRTRRIGAGGRLRRASLNVVAKKEILPCPKSNPGRPARRLFLRLLTDYFCNPVNVSDSFWQRILRKLRFDAEELSPLQTS
jgi:hypothetical protein